MAAVARPQTAQVDRRLREHPLLAGWDWEQVRRYGAQYSEVLEYRCRSDPSKPSILIKHRLGIVPAERTEESLAREFRGLQALWSRAGAALEGTMPKPIAYLPEVLAIVFEKLPGTTLETLLKRRGNRLAGRFCLPTFFHVGHQLGRWLRRFQQATAQPPLPHDSTVYLERVLTWLDRCRRGGMSEAIAAEVGALARRAADRIEGSVVPAAASHGDLIPVNILVDGARIAVVDFGGVREREPVYKDAGFLAAYWGLMENSGFYSRPVMKALQRGFLAGYGNVDSPALLDLYVVEALLDILACQFEARRKGWRRLRKLETYLAAESRRRLGPP